jgi:uncharacterized membrane protein
MRWFTAGTVLGIGLGGQLDGIVLHQVAQWHNMGSAILPPVTMAAMSRNMTWDGLFHGAAWAIVLYGIYMLRRAALQGAVAASGAVFTGEMIFGWGLFNLVEGAIDHHVLGLHHVRDMPVHVPLYDWMFLGIGGVGFLLVGWLLMRPVRQPIRA